MELKIDDSPVKEGENGDAFYKRLGISEERKDFIVGEIGKHIEKLLEDDIPKLEGFKIVAGLCNNDEELALSFYSYGRAIQMVDEPDLPPFSGVMDFLRQVKGN